MNVFEACGEAMTEAGSSLHGIKVGGDPASPIYAANPGLVFVGQSGDARDTYQGGVVGGTAWLFTRPEWVGELDFLFIDEAGQVSLANVVAMGTSARNIVLVGDQMQLAQPIQGAHPGESGLSALDYMLQGEATVAPERGILLDTSWRMHPSICDFISDAVYDGRLKAHPDCARQRLHLGADHDPSLAESGLRFVAMNHEGCGQRSDAEDMRVN